MDRPSVEALHAATGGDYDDWFAVLDAAGGSGLEHSEHVELLTGEHALVHWWAQAVATAYQQDRALRPAGATTGALLVSASRNLRVPVERAYEAFADPELRARWLPGAMLAEEAAVPPRALRFVWGKAGARVNVGFTAHEGGRTTVGLVHERITDPTVAEATRMYWQDRLADLKALLEGRPSPAPDPVVPG